MPAGVAEYSSTGSERIDVANCQARPGIICAIEVKETETVGGIILPDVGEAQKMRVGYAFKVGPGEPDGHGGEKYRFIQAGDYFTFGKYQSGGEPLKFNGQMILLLRQDDVVWKLATAPARMAAAAAKALHEFHGLPLAEVKAA